MLSVNDSKKEQNEVKCLDEAIQLAKNKRAMTRNVMSMLSGATIKRAKNDRPDIIRVWHSNNPNVDDVFIGIEHFLVDQTTKKRGKKSESIGAECRNHIWRSYEAAHDAREQGQKIPEEITEKLVKDIFKLAMAANESGYEELLASLKINLTTHAKRAKEYREEIQKVAGKNPIQLVLLLEIQCHFPHLFLNYGHRTFPNKGHLMPMFREVVDELETVDSNSVDYIILYIKDTVDTQLKNVIAVKTGNVAKSLHKQAIQIYEYCGMDADLQFVNIKYEKVNDDGYHFNYSIKHSANATQMEAYIPALKSAYAAIHQGKPFATTRNIQGFLCAFGKNVKFSSNPDDDLLFSVYDTDAEEILRRFDAFTAKYPVGEKMYEQS